MNMNPTLLKKSRSMVHHHPQTHSKTEVFGIEQTSAFLKHQISQLIKQQLKAYHLRNKLEQQLEQYNKLQEDKKLARNMMQDRINDFREKQKNYRRKQYEIFQKKQKERQKKLKIFMKNKEGNHLVKCFQVNQSLTNVRDKYLNLAHEDSMNRLSKLAPFTSEGRRMHRSSHNDECRTVSVSQCSSRINLIKTMQAEQQKHKITNYLNKIERSQSKVLLKEIQNEKRRQTSLRKKVKCLVGQRKKNEQDLMNKAERQYNQRMQAFATNHSRITETKQISLMTRAVFNARTRDQILHRRQQIHKQEIDKIVNNYNGKSKENILQEYRSTLDLSYTHKNRNLNLAKKKVTQDARQLQNNMRSLTQKVQRLKNMQYGQKLDENTIKSIISLMDKNDPEYGKILDFLKSERKAFIQGIVKKQEQKNKLKKSNKAANKTNPL